MKVGPSDRRDTRRGPGRAGSAGTRLREALTDSPPCNKSPNNRSVRVTRRIPCEACEGRIVGAYLWSTAGPAPRFAVGCQTPKLVSQPCGSGAGNGKTSMR